MTLRALIAVITLFSTACASVVNRGPQEIHVDSRPAGAAATATCNGNVVSRATTPGSVSVPRQAAGCSITIAKEGFRTHAVHLTRGRSGAYWGNLGFFGPLPAAAIAYALGADPADNTATYGVIGALAVTGIVGFIRDRSTGAMYVHEPDEVTVELEQDR